MSRQFLSPDGRRVKGGQVRGRRAAPRRQSIQVWRGLRRRTPRATGRMPPCPLLQWTARRSANAQRAPAPRSAHRCRDGSSPIQSPPDRVRAAAVAVSPLVARLRSPVQTLRWQGGRARAPLRQTRGNGVGFRSRFGDRPRYPKNLSRSQMPGAHSSTISRHSERMHFAAAKWCVSFGLASQAIRPYICLGIR